MFYIYLYIFFLIREGKTGVGERAEGEGEVLSQVGSMLNAEPDVVARSQNPEITTWAKIKSRTLNGLSHPGTPDFTNIYLKMNNMDLNCMGPLTHGFFSFTNTVQYCKCIFFPLWFS